MAINSFRIDKSVSLVPQASAPSSPTNGDIYYDATLGFQRYEAGAWGSFASASTGVTYSATAGETLLTNVPVYISEGAADGGRTAGRVYKLDATNPFRSKYAGFTTAGISSGVSGTIQIGGYLAGFTGLTAGQIAYASVTTPGTLQATEPNQLGYKKVELLIALSSTTAIIVANPNSNYGSNKSDDGKTINYIINSGAEVDTTGWATYADAAGTTPVDGTGGSPSITLTASSSSPLRGANSFLITKGATNRQGDGVSYDFTIDAADKGKSLGVSFDFDALTTVVGDSSDIRVFLYDITNSSLIQPMSYTINAAAGTFSGSFSATTSTSYRLILHVATTNASATTFKFDNVFVGPQVRASGLAGSDWINESSLFTPNSGFGTISNKTIFTRRVGDTLHVRGYFKTGTHTATAVQIDFTKYAIDFTKFPSITSTQRLGSGESLRQSGVVFDGNDDHLVFFADSAASSTAIFIAIGATTPGTDPEYRKVGGTSLGSTDGAMSFELSFPVVGWSSGITLNNSSVFNISNVIANGTRVTATPAALGEYRTYVKSVNATSGTDNAPSTAPTAADGMLIYSAAYNAAGTSGQTNRWEIFVGKRKNVFPQFYSSAGKTGVISVDRKIISTTIEEGLEYSYDPTTGVLLIDAMDQETTVTTRRVGKTIGAAGAAPAAATNCYFDVVIAENALTVGVDAPRSSIRVATANGWGSTNTAIRRFSVTLESIGSAITYADSSTLGASFTINEDGIYSIQYSNITTTGPDTGISKNSTQLTTGINSITQADALIFVSNVTGGNGCASWTGFLKAGDVIRPHDVAGLTGASDVRVRFVITKVAN